MPETQSPIPELNDALSELAAIGKEYNGHPGTLLPDFVLYALAMDVWEHATAVKLLTEGPVPRAALANARAALESCIDLAYLVSDEAQYCPRGAQARVAELFETNDIEERAAPLNLLFADGAAKRMDVESAVADDAADWDRRAPGKGVHLRRAWEAFTKDRGALRRHWSGLSKQQLYRVVLDSPGDSVPLGQMGDVLHAVLSIGTHPGPRVGMREITVLPDGTIHMGTKSSDVGFGRGVAALACTSATESLRKRAAFSDRAA